MGKSYGSTGVGFRDVKHQIAADSNMLHRIASIAKPMTAVAMMQLVEQGRLNLDKPIQEYLPTFPIKPKGTITVRHLLNHSAGIRAYKNGKEGFPTTHYPTLQDALRIFQEDALLFEPGKGYQYSTYNYVVLGAILESLTGQIYETYMNKNVWEPTGMSCTTIEKFGHQYAHKAQLYQKGKKGKFKSDRQTDLSSKIPGGGLQSTIGDLLRFGAAVYHDQLIKRGSLDQLIADTGLKTEGNPYGMGWYIYGKKDGPNGRIIGHSGSQSGTSAQLLIFLDHGIVVACFANSSGCWNEVVNGTFELAGIAKKL